MALPASGEITFGDLNNQLRRGSLTAQISLNDSQVRGLAVKPSGAISMSNLHNKWAGSRVTVAPTTNISGLVGYGFKSATWSGSGSKQGNCEGEYAGAVCGTVVWSSNIGGGIAGMYVGTEGNEPQPTSQTLKITDDSFNVINTVSLSTWTKMTEAGWGPPINAWYASASVPTNPLGTTTGAKRWFTW